MATTQATRVLVMAADSFACGHLRLIWPALAVKEQDTSFDVTIVPAGDPSGFTVYADENGRARDVSVPDCDLIVLQRPTFPQVASAIPVLRSKGIAVIVDIDDDLSHIHPDNPAFAAMHPNPGSLLDPRLVDHMRRTRGLEPRQGKHSWSAVKEACVAATMTTVSTPALAERYGRGNARVLYNYIPEAALNAPRQDSAVIGWAGSTHSHPGDLKAMGSSIAQLVRGGAEFMVVGDGTGADRDLGLPMVPQTGPVEFRLWPSAVAQIGVGVAPLLDTRFNIAKSWLKPLELSAAGVPWVASPRAEYRRLHALGCGALAEKPREWVRELRRLTQDDVYRSEKSDEARAVAAKMTIQQHAWRWAETWADAVAVERGRLRA